MLSFANSSAIRRALVSLAEALQRVSVHDLRLQECRYGRVFKISSSAVKFPPVFVFHLTLLFFSYRKIFFCQYTNVCKDVTTNGKNCGRVGANKTCSNSMCGDLSFLPGSFADLVQNRSGVVHADGAVFSYNANGFQLVSVGDVNADSWPDLYVSYGETTFFYGGPNLTSVSASQRKSCFFHSTHIAYSMRCKGKQT